MSDPEEQRPLVLAPNTDQWYRCRRCRHVWVRPDSPATLVRLTAECPGCHRRTTHQQTATPEQQTAISQLSG